VGFYILFKRYSLMNVLLYIAVWVSSLYSFAFPSYSRVGMATPAYWHAAMAWGHFCMAITLWFVPQFYRLSWPRLKTGVRVASLGLAALVVLTPSVFAQWKAATWEAPIQTRIDQATFSRPNLVSLKGGLSLLSTGADARYQFTLRVGPRDYRNWFKQQRALDAASVQVSGRLWQDGRILAWCDARMASLPSPNGIVSPLDFPPAMRAMRFTDIPVPCSGPAAGDPGVGSMVTVEWKADMTLIG